MRHNRRVRFFETRCTTTTSNNNNNNVSFLFHVETSKHEDSLKLFSLQTLELKFKKNK